MQNGLLLKLYRLKDVFSTSLLQSLCHLLAFNLTWKADKYTLEKRDFRFKVQHKVWDDYKDLRSQDFQVSYGISNSVS